MIFVPTAACFACGKINCDWDCKETYIKQVDALKLQNERLIKENSELKGFNDKITFTSLYTQNETLIKALKYYADKSNWTEKIPDGLPDTEAWKTILPWDFECNDDLQRGSSIGGKLARQTLADLGIKGGKNE